MEVGSFVARGRMGGEGGIQQGDVLTRPGPRPDQVILAVHPSDTPLDLGMEAGKHAKAKALAETYARSAADGAWRATLKSSACGPPTFEAETWYAVAVMQGGLLPA